jgi:hypothetical protein
VVFVKSRTMETSVLSHASNRLLAIKWG